LSYNNVVQQFINYFQIADQLNNSPSNLQANIANAAQISSIQNNLQNVQTYYSSILKQSYYSTPITESLMQTVVQGKSALDSMSDNSFSSVDINKLSNDTITNLLLSYGFTVTDLPIPIQKRILTNLVANYKIKGTLQSVANMVADVVDVPILVSELYFEKWCQALLPLWTYYCQEFPSNLASCMKALNIQPYIVNTLDPQLPPNNVTAVEVNPCNSVPITNTTTQTIIEIPDTFVVTTSEINSPGFAFLYTIQNQGQTFYCYINTNAVQYSTQNTFAVFPNEITYTGYYFLFAIQEDGQTYFCYLNTNEASQSNNAFAISQTQLTGSGYYFLFEESGYYCYINTNSTMPLSAIVTTTTTASNTTSSSTSQSTIPTFIASYSAIRNPYYALIFTVNYGTSLIYCYANINATGYSNSNTMAIYSIPTNNPNMVLLFSIPYGNNTYYCYINENVITTDNAFATSTVPINDSNYYFLFQFSNYYCYINMSDVVSGSTSASNSSSSSSSSSNATTNLESFLLNQTSFVDISNCSCYLSFELQNVANGTNFVQVPGNLISLEGDKLYLDYYDSTAQHVYLSFSYDEPYSVPGSSGVLTKRLPYLDVIDSFWMLTLDYMVNDYPYPKVMSPYFITILYFDTGNYLYATELLRQYCYQNYLTYYYSNNFSDYPSTRVLTSTYLTNPFNYLEGWLMIRYLWCMLTSITDDIAINTTAQSITGNNYNTRRYFQHFLTGSILNTTNEFNESVFYGGAYCNPNYDNQNAVIMTGMNTNQILIMNQYSSEVIMYDQDNNTFDGSIDLAKMFLYNSNITENVPIYLYGNGNQLSVSPQVFDSGISNWNGPQGSYPVGSYLNALMFDGQYFSGIQEVLISYDNVNDVTTTLKLEGDQNQIVVTMNSKPTYSNANMIQTEFVSQYMTRYTNSFSDIKVTSYSALTGQIDSETVVLDYDNIGNVKSLNLDGWLNFQILYINNVLMIFGGTLNGQITDRLVAMDPYSFKIVYDTNIGIFLVDPIVIADGKYMVIYGGYDSNGVQSNVFCLVDVNEYSVYISDKSEYIIPYNGGNYYTSYDSINNVSYLTMFSGNTATVYAISVYRPEPYIIGTITDLSNQSTYSSVCTENGVLYIGYINTQGYYIIYTYQDQTGFQESTNQYFQSIPPLFAYNFVSQACCLSNNRLTNVSIDISNNILNTFLSNYVFNGVTSSNTSCSIQPQLTISNLSGIAKSIYLQYQSDSLYSYVQELYNNSNYTPSELQVQELLAIFTQLWSITSGQEFDWSNLPQMLECYNSSLQAYISELFNCIITYTANNWSPCNVQTLIQYNLNQIVNNIDQQTVYNMISNISTNYIISLESISGEIPLLSISNNANCGSKTQQRQIGNLSPSVGVICDSNSNGSVIYIITTQPVLSLSGVVDGSMSYLPNTTSARTFRDLELGYPNIYEVGNRNFDLEAKYSSLPDISSLTDIQNYLSIFCPTNYNQLTTIQNMEGAIYDILESMSSLVPGVDFTLIYTPQTLDSVDEIEGIFKPMQSRSVFNNPIGVQFSDPVGDWITLGDSSVKFSMMKSIYSYMLLRDAYDMNITSELYDTETMTSEIVYQAIDTENSTILSFGSITECYSESSMDDLSFLVTTGNSTYDYGYLPMFGTDFISDNSTFDCHLNLNALLMNTDTNSNFASSTIPITDSGYIPLFNITSGGAIYYNYLNTNTINDDTNFNTFVASDVPLNGTNYYNLFNVQDNNGVTYYCYINDSELSPGSLFQIGG
jgi:hypothetical protein